jgi:hypothetical protein
LQLHQYADASRFFEGVHHVVTRDLREPFEERAAELRPDGGREPEDPFRLLGQASEPAFDRLLHAFGEADLLDPRERIPRDPAGFRADLSEVAKDLFDEERIPRRLLPERFDEHGHGEVVVPGSVGPAQVGDFREGQALQTKSLSEAVVPEICEEIRERVVG